MCDGASALNLLYVSWISFISLISLISWSCRSVHPHVTALYTDLVAVCPHYSGRFIRRRLSYSAGSRVCPCRSHQV